MSGGQRECLDHRCSFSWEFSRVGAARRDSKNWGGPQLDPAADATANRWLAPGGTAWYCRAAGPCVLDTSSPVAPAPPTLGSEELATAVDHQRLSRDKGRPWRGEKQRGADHVAGNG